MCAPHRGTGLDKIHVEIKIMLMIAKTFLISLESSVMKKRFLNKSIKIMKQKKFINICILKPLLRNDSNQSEKLDPIIYAFCVAFTL
tara:strand:+ start:84 stop:344 length:261 start_codon:yes stop_codon:yes gene_type:complete